MSSMYVKKQKSFKFSSYISRDEIINMNVVLSATSKKSTMSVSSYDDEGLRESS